jgi:hypothetical protein
MQEKQLNGFVELKAVAFSRQTFILLFAMTLAKELKGTKMKRGGCLNKERREEISHAHSSLVLTTSVVSAALKIENAALNLCSKRLMGGTFRPFFRGQSTIKWESDKETKDRHGDYTCVVQRSGIGSH